MTNHALLRHMAASGTPMVISTGMSTEGEIRETVELIRSTGVAHAFLHCQSTYPAPFKDVNLAYLTRLAEITQAPVGYSGHERGFHVAGRRRRARRADHREALHRRPRPRGQRPQGQPAARRVQGDGAAGPRGRGGARHGRAPRGLHRRDDEPRQPRQVARRRPPHRGRRDAHRRRHRHQEPRPRPPAQRLRQARRAHDDPRARAPATSSTPPTSATPRRRAAPTTSAAPGAWPSATTTSTR